MLPEASIRKPSWVVRGAAYDASYANAIAKALHVCRRILDRVSILGDSLEHVEVNNLTIGVIGFHFSNSCANKVCY